ncbi:hypothetical protein TSUD_319080 [Trifolium subterraneum]|uniref:RNase H type-1 domain-containing protein n=1 Tax=Trifolium subterraneum TaxID=3900 RepID=A0A2Z6MXJ1_TRISU|nr:hypothetical protein TSUD_319080 [Trifolium subterraneum]
MLSGGANMSIFDVHWTTPPRGYYKLNVDAAGPIEASKWDIGVVVRDVDGFVVVVAVGKSFHYQIIAESYASIVILALNNRQQSLHYVGSIMEGSHSMNFVVFFKCSSFVQRSSFRFNIH